MACVADTDSVALSINGATGALEASAKLSEDPENIAEVRSDGLFVGAVDLTIPVGAVVPFAGSAAPTGWLLCDGGAVSRSTYANLFSVLSTTYGGGDGSTTFNVPDLVGRVVVGLNLSNTDVDSMGENDGLPAASRSVKHNTTVTRVNDVTVGGGPFSKPGALSAAGGGADNDATGNPIVTQQPTFSGGPGGSRPTDTPAFLVLKYIIKA